jgi:hypothetical protein
MLHLGDGDPLPPWPHSPPWRLALPASRGVSSPPAPTCCLLLLPVGMLVMSDMTSLDDRKESMPLASCWHCGRTAGHGGVTAGQCGMVSATGPAARPRCLLINPGCSRRQLGPATAFIILMLASSNSYLLVQRLQPHNVKLGLLHIGATHPT